MGTNSGVEPARGHVPSARAAVPVGWPSLSTQSGDTRRPKSTGTAAFKISCLSAIDGELSIMNRRSILSTFDSKIESTNTLLVLGVLPTPPAPGLPPLPGAGPPVVEQPRHTNPNHPHNARMSL